MLHTSQLKNLFKWKYFFLVPIVGLVLTFSSCGNDKSDADQDKVTLEENEKNDKEDKYEGTPEKSMKASKAQKSKKSEDLSSSAPTSSYPGCEGNADSMKECTSEKIQEYVADNFDANAVGEKVKKGDHRVYAQFIVDKKGMVDNVKTRSESPELATEAERILASLPQMQPAMEDGKPIESTHTLPIVFKIQ